MNIKKPRSSNVSEAEKKPTRGMGRANHGKEIPAERPRRPGVITSDTARDELSHEIEQLKLHLQEASDEIEWLKQEADRYRRAKDSMSSAYEALYREYQNSRYEVFRPLYRRLFRGAGSIVRSVLGNSFAESLRQRIPHPDRLAAQPVASNVDLSSREIEPSAIDPPTELGDVFVFSIIDWEFRIQRPQHISRELSADRRVFYIEMTQSEDTISVHRLQRNLYRVRMPSHQVGFIRPYVGRPSPTKILRWLDQFSAFCDSISSNQTKHVIIQHPFWWQFLRHLPPEFQVVFDCMDDISGFSNTEPFLLSLERDLIEKCDRLVVSSDYLNNKYAGMKKPVIVRNAGQIEHFVRDGEADPPDYLLQRGLTDSGKTVKIGYVGAIAEWFDWPLLKSVAEAEPDFDFHLCGSVTAPGPRELEGLPNVHLYGEVPYASVPAFIAQMDVMIIPFHIIPLIEACDPVKFYEYSAMGKPTVAARLPELERAKEIVFFASTPDEFREQVRKAVSSDEPFRTRLVSYAQSNTWTDRASQFQAVLADHPLVSVVVLSFGHPSWTLATLHSLTDHGGHYPNLEIIVVDNGSTEDDLSKIREFAHLSRSNVVLIENGENLGFARGNNVGIEAATGDYILLLNNDTFVAPGALYAMISHLERDSRIGVVGPLTNNIGNEARIEVAYADMSEMKKVARSVTMGYRGISTEQRVVAYFAAMFRAGDLKRFGLLSEAYGRGMFEDDDHCEVIRSMGYSCALAEDAFVHHQLSATFSTIGDEEKRALFEKNRAIFEERWGEWTPHRYRSERPLGSFEELIP